MPKFQLVAPFKPCGDQQQAIDKLTDGLQKNLKYQTLFGVTGSGKTFTMANVVSNVQRPTLVVSHNKTLAAQLYSEFKEFFPYNAVEYFVSYYDYYQPEAYVPQADIYIEKDASINDNIDRLRLSATSSLMSRSDVIIVASVSCIYGLGSPEDYKDLLLFLKKKEAIKRSALLSRLVNIHYTRNDVDFKRGCFRVRGDTIDIFPAYKETFFRISLFGDEIEKISELDPVSGSTLADFIEKIAIYPAKHFVTTQERIDSAIRSIEVELEERLKELRAQNKLLEAQRLGSRTRYDIEMLQEMGFCNGIENYSRHLSQRLAGSRPSCLLDYFPENFLTIIDESHVTMPQLRGMYNGDRARKQTLVDYGFRLPSALDNRPLSFEEFMGIVHETVFVSATPSEYELQNSGRIAEQVIRPTGLLDPEITVKPTENQIQDLVENIKQRASKNQRVFVTTLTKRMSEDLAGYLKELGLKARYIHSELDTIERSEILRDLRMQKFDCLVGINLLREGLDLPEVALVAILDADKEGFLRSETSLIQVAGRAARNIDGHVIMYADNITSSMRKAIEETNRRRKKQAEFNKANNITPRSIEKAIRNGIESLKKAEEIVIEATGQSEEDYEKEMVIAEFEREMELLARNLQFERAAKLRDRIKELKNNAG
ncbi:MAG: excinuclease ABC subunit B [Omnitrophica bacterium GWA2_41_15]|nr:MAG: excinuclease ABC subunit B [Omnitrophica bacterium GWA2_41_15]HAZ10935.1 excinuclease ABC subunit B [Candidatus Omnitrophota bacterium]